MLFNLLFFLFFLLNSSFCCNFKAHIRSETDRDVWAQFTFHNKSTSEIFTFSKYGETKILRITGEMCNLAPTVLKSYEEYPKKGVKPVGETTAHLEGNGDMYYKIFPKDGPRAVRAEGMFCAWGQCRIGK